MSCLVSPVSGHGVREVDRGPRNIRIRVQRERKNNGERGVESVSRERETALVRISGGRVLSSAAFARPPYAVLSHIVDRLCRGAGGEAGASKLPPGRAGGARVHSALRRVSRAGSLAGPGSRGGGRASFLGLPLWLLGVFPHGRGGSSLHGTAARGSQKDDTLDPLVRGRVSRFLVRDRVACQANMVRPHEAVAARRK